MVSWLKVMVEGLGRGQLQPRSQEKEMERKREREREKLGARMRAFSSCVRW